MCEKCDIITCAGNCHHLRPDSIDRIIKEMPVSVASGTSPILCRFQWPRGRRRSSAAARLLRSWVRIPPGAWISVCCECRVLSGRGLCDELITRPEESYRLCCVVVCDLETSRMGAPYIYMPLVAKG